MTITLTTTELGKVVSVETYNAILIGVGIGVLALVVSLIFTKGRKRRR